MLVHETSLRIGADHPSLPGHFPGRPIVPGVVLLDGVIAACERWLERSVHITSLTQVKFLTPLLPEETARMSLQLDGEKLRFTLARDGETIAQGMFEIEGSERADGDRA